MTILTSKPWRVVGGLLLAIVVLAALAFSVPDALAHRRGGGRDGGRNGGNEQGRPPRGETQVSPSDNNDGNATQALRATPQPQLTPTSETVNTAQFLAARTLDGSANNFANPTLGMAGTNFVRIAEPAYADGIGEMALEVNPRYVSNRIYNDQALNLFSENGVTHWGFVWGQFLDHSIGLRSASSEERLQFPFDADDPLEEFENDMGALSFLRSAVAEGSGVNSPREQVNTLSSYIDGGAVYGVSAERLDWLRVGSLDGDPSNNSAELLLTTDGYLPLATERGNPSEAPVMELMGRLRLDPTAAVIAGDARANENLGLTAVQTLFVREHNRIVDALPDTLDENVKFEIARRVVGATQQYITYEEFLPAFGLELDRYTGYDPTVDPSVTNEFAAVGYRAHSMIHGEFEMAAELSAYTQAELDNLEAQGIEIEISGDEVEFAIPLNIAFGQPHLLSEIGLGSVLQGLASEAQYSNDETIDNQLRSVLFQIPAPGATNPAACLDGEDLPDCFAMVSDLGVLDMLRAYDHGIPNYNDLRVAYGLQPIRSFTQMTGESTASFPNDIRINANDPINDPNILDVMQAFDADGRVVSVDDPEALPVEVVQRTTLAARLQAIYGSVDNVDAFTGMMSEPHIDGTEFGELQLAMWQQQFEALRDGDRFFYGNDSVLDTIRDTYGIDYRQSLATVIANNTELGRRDLSANVFLTGE